MVGTASRVCPAMQSEALRLRATMMSRKPWLLRSSKVDFANKPTKSRQQRLYRLACICATLLVDRCEAPPAQPQPCHRLDYTVPYTVYSGRACLVWRPSLQTVDMVSRKKDSKQ